MDLIFPNLYLDNMSNSELDLFPNNIILYFKFMNIIYRNIKNIPIPLNINILF